jgi:AhpD family alkylhydroperoxidase
MTEVRFENRRFDPDLTPFHEIAKQMAKAFGYTAELHIDRRLAQLLRLQVAQKNSCSYCLILHSKAARDQGVETAKADSLGAWWESGLYTAAERAALAYCDALTDGDQPGFQANHDLARAHFSETEIAEMAAIVINMNVWTRLKLAQGAKPEYAA